jgi:hypothetical protein
VRKILKKRCGRFSIQSSGWIPIHPENDLRNRKFLHRHRPPGVGSIDTGERINILGVIIEKRITVYEILNLQVATHPLLTFGPTSYPIIQAAQNIVVRHIIC